MARRHPSNEKHDEGETAAEGGIPGGGEGVIQEASTMINVPGATANAGAPPTPEAEAVKPSRYRVEGPGPNKDGTWPVLLGGLRVDLRPGKVFDTASYDVDKIRAQGVRLTELAD